MSSRFSYIIFAGIVILSILILAGLTWLNHRYSSENPIGNFFLPRWLGTRLFLLEGLSPYSDQTSHAITEMYHQRYGQGDETMLSFMYPLFSIFVFAPFALIADYGFALSAWMTVLEVSIISVAFASLSLCRWKLKPFGIVAILVFSALWYHNIRPLITGDTTLLLSFFVSAALLAVRLEHDGLAGFLLAISMVKPQVIILLVIFILTWSISNRRWTLVWSFIGSLALMIAFTSLLMPDWTWQYFRQVFIYLNKTSSITPGTVLAAWIPGVGKQLGWALTIILLGTLFWEWRATINKDFRQVLWTACLTLVITQLIGFRTSIDNYSILFPAMLLVLSTWFERWGKLGRWLAVFGAFTMLFGLWALVINAVRDGAQLEIDPLVFFFAPVLIMAGLYWVRWWAINPPYSPYEYTSLQ